MTQPQSSNPEAARVRKLTPYLITDDAAGLIEFVKRTFAGEETFRAIGSAGGTVKPVCS